MSYKSTQGELIAIGKTNNSDRIAAECIDTWLQSFLLYLTHHCVSHLSRSALDLILTNWSNLVQGLEFGQTSSTVLLIATEVIVCKGR